MQCKHFPDVSSENQILEIINQLAQYLGEEYYQYPFVSGLLFAARAEGVSKASGIIDNDRQGSTFTPRRGPFSEWRSLKNGFFRYPFNEWRAGVPRQNHFGCLKLGSTLKIRKLTHSRDQHPTGGKPQRGIDICIDTRIPT